MLRLGRRFLSTAARSRKGVGIIGVPFTKGQPRHGTECAPDKMREAGLIKTLRDVLGNHCDIKDFGNLQYVPEDLRQIHNMKNWNDVYSCNTQLARQVKEILQDNRRFLVIGGDHSIGLGSVSGHLSYNPHLILIWIDAHADLNLNTTSPTGNAHGMPVSMIVEELSDFWAKQQKFDWITHRIPAKNVVYIGLRDVDPYENYLIKKLGINAFAMDAVDRYGVRNIIEMTLEKLDPERKKDYHVSFDIDAIDPRDAPSTGTAVPGGLTLREGIYIMELLSKTCNISGMDLVEVNPAIGDEKDVRQTIRSGLEIIKAAFGYERLGSSEGINGAQSKVKIN